MKNVFSKGSFLRFAPLSVFIPNYFEVLLISIDRLSAERPCDTFEFRTFSASSSLIGQNARRPILSAGREGTEALWELLKETCTEITNAKFTFVINPEMIDIAVYQSTLRQVCANENV